MANQWIEITRRQAVDRALADAKLDVTYDLGAGGYDCRAAHAPQNGRLDCSGGVAFWVGTDRQTNRIDGGWIETSMVEADATGPRRLFAKVALSDSEPGDILVYGDSGGHEGHIGLITAVANGKPSTVCHCTARGGIPSAIINEPYSTFWAGAVADRGAIAAAHLWYVDTEAIDVDETTVMCNGVKGRGYFDEGSNFPDLALVKAWMVDRGAVFGWDAGTKTLTITLPTACTEAEAARVTGARAPRKFSFVIED